MTSVQRGGAAFICLFIQAPDKEGEGRKAVNKGVWAVQGPGGGVSPASHLGVRLLAGHPRNAEHWEGVARPPAPQRLCITHPEPYLQQHLPYLALPPRTWQSRTFGSFSHEHQSVSLEQVEWEPSALRSVWKGVRTAPQALPPDCL